MCSVAAAGIGLMVAGAVSGGDAAHDQATGEREYLRFQADEARRRQQLLTGSAADLLLRAGAAADDALLRGEDMSRDALERGRQENFKSRLKTGQLEGAQRARMAAAGLDLDEGSAHRILSDTDWLGDMDAHTIDQNSAREAWWERSDAAREAWQMRSAADREAWLLREEASAAGRASGFYTSAAQAIHPNRARFLSMLGGAGRVASSWYSLGRA